VIRRRRHPGHKGEDEREREKQLGARDAAQWIDGGGNPSGLPMD